MTTIGGILIVGLPVLAVVLPLCFSAARWLRNIIVFLLLAHLICTVHYGLRLAARNVPLPTQETMRKEVAFVDAWKQGLSDTQKQVDSYRLSMIMSIIALSALAVMPRSQKTKDAGG